MKKSQFKQLVKEVIKENAEFSWDRSERLAKSFIGKTIKSVDYDHYGGTISFDFTDGTHLGIVSQSNEGESWISIG